jgi:lysophospholipase L1-like esterase
MGKFIMTRFLKKIVILIFVNLLVFSVLGGIVFFVLNYYCEKRNILTNLGPIYYSGIHQSVRHELKPNTIVWSSGVEYKINSLGFRDNEYPFSKRTGTYRILCVGDSFTFGQGIKLKDSYPKVLEKTLQHKYQKDIEVINTAVCGYNTYDEYWYIKNKLLKLKPDMIILGFSISNVPEDPSIPFNTKMIVKQDTVSKKLPLVQFLREKATCMQLQKEDYWTQYSLSIWDPNGPQWKRCAQALKDIKELTDQNNIKLMVLIIPIMASSPQDEIGHHKQLTTLLDSLDVKYVDALKRLLDTKREYLYVSKEDCHPNPKMHEIYAEVIVSELKKSGLIKHGN